MAGETGESRLPRWAVPAAIVLAVAAIAALSFVERWRVLTSSPFPLGVDGYFYPVQLRALLESGHLQYPASPLAFWLLAPFAAATDPITGTKLGAAVYGALIAVPAYGVGAQLGRSRGAGLVASAIATWSAGSLYLTVEFVKNAIGITVALGALWLILRALAVPRRGRIVAACGGIVAALLAHKLAAALVIGVAIVGAIVEAIERGVLRGRRLIYLLGGLAVLAIGLLALGHLAPKRFLSLDDLRLVETLLSDEPRWSLPVLDTPATHVTLRHEPLLAALAAAVATVALIAERRTWRGRLRTIGKILVVLGALAIIVGVIVPLAIAGGVVVVAGGMFVLARAKRMPVPRLSATTQVTTRGATVVPWLVILLAVVIAVPWLAVDDPQGLAMRLRVIAFVPLALCTAIALRLVRSLLADDAALCAVLAVVVVATGARGRPEGVIPPHPALVSAVLAIDGRVQPGELVVVPERHLAFMVAWYARVPVSLRPVDDARWRLLPLARTRDTALAPALLAVRDRAELPPVIGLHPWDPNGLVLVPEVTWRYLLDHLPPSERARWLAWPTI
ncbi:MAG TPA: hypothetical protein VFQ53_09065 [Kofleriaceae bacterium]|nr:hypothetical protein [Kofleriaceae bacterium]